MTQRIPDRLQWAVEILDVQLDEHILEIGSGHGAAISLVCDQLASGTITALDRSEKMIKMASKRNRDYLEAGKVRFLQAELADATWNGRMFDKVFAFHVNVFWMKPARELAAVRAGLKPNGILYLFYQPLDAGKADQLVSQLTSNLQANGFRSIRGISTLLPSGLTLCVMGRP
jgi:SAM-dependent methyltransferase